MNKSTKLAAGIVLALMAGQALAAEDTVDVKVTGQIVPPACVPAVTGGAVFDYGAIKAASLSQDNYTVLPQKSLTFSLTCDSPTKVAFKSTDGRAGSAVIPVGSKLWSDNYAAVTADTPMMGLGLDGTKKIGGYQLRAVIGNSSVTTDGQTVKSQSLRSTDNGATWVVPGATDVVWFPDYAQSGQITSIAATGTLSPVAITSFSGTMNVQAVINKGSELDLTKTTNFEGLTTIQVIYL